jgi:hypothetical protein
MVPGSTSCGRRAFYTDVTDAHRLRKGGRLRTDLRGVYFNVVVATVTDTTPTATTTTPTATTTTGATATTATTP